MDHRLATLLARRSAIKARLILKSDFQEEFVLRMQFIDVNYEIYMHKRSVNQQLSKEGALEHTGKASPKLLEGNSTNTV